MSIIMALYYTTDSALGVNLYATTTAIQFTLGTRVLGSNSSEWIYGLVPTTSQAVAQYDFVTVDPSGNINSLMAANVKLGQQIAVAQVAIAAGSYGWVCITGAGLLGNVVASVQNNVPVIPSTTTGRIDTTAGVAAGVTSILGVSIPLTAGLTATALGLGLTNPVLKL